MQLPFGMGWDSRFSENPGAKNQAVGQITSTLLQQPAAFADTLGKNYGNYAQASQGYFQGLAGLGSSQANNYAAYAGGLGNLAQAQANANNNNQLLNTGYNSMAEAARQGALANLGSAALGAYGSASGSALGAWAQNQSAYNKMLSDLGSANQAGLSQLGQSRNAALGGLGAAYSRSGVGMAVADALGGMDFGGGGGSGFQATGTDGEIASGSYGGSGGGRGSRSSALSGISDRMFGGLDATRGDLNSTDIQDRMDANYANTLGMANYQHMTSRDMPSQMLGQTLSGLMSLNKFNAGESSRGMDQYYANVTPISTRPGNEIAVNDVLSGLTYGYRDSSDRLGGIQSQMGSGWNDTTRGLNAANDSVADMWDSSIGNMMLSPAEELRRQREADLLRRQYTSEDARALADLYRGRENLLRPDVAKGAGLRPWFYGQYFDPWNPAVSSGGYGTASYPTPRT